MHRTNEHPEPALRRSFSRALGPILALISVAVPPGCAPLPDAPDADEEVGIAEQAAMSPAQNLARGRPTIASSGAYGGDPARAVDGNTDGNWFIYSVTHTDYDAQPFWQVDLQASHPIGNVVVWNRTDCCSDRLTNFSVLVSDDGASWQAYTFPGQAGQQVTMAVNRTGRYVRVRLNQPGYLSLAEVQVFPQTENLALGKPTTQSSTDWGGVASRAVDGVADGNWFAGSVTHTLNQPQPWWQVDLQVPQAVGSVVLHNRNDCCSDRLSNYNLLVSNDGASWQVYSWGGGVSQRASFALNRTARFIKVQLQGTNALSLAEVQVFAASSGQQAYAEPATYAASFYGFSTMRDGGADWDGGRWKATCGAGEALRGLSANPWDRARIGLCAAVPGAYTGTVTATLTSDAKQSVRRAARLGDWAPGDWKLECGSGEYVRAISQNTTADGSIHAVQCAAGTTNAGLRPNDVCSVRVFDTVDDRGTTASGDWDAGGYKGECLPDEQMAGVSLDPANGRPRSILCCGRGASPAPLPAQTTGNTVYGRWANAGGQSATHAENRTFYADVATAGQVTFDLASSANGYLYLLDMANHLIASDDNSGGGLNPRITAQLAAGTYKVVAATYAPGHAAPFDLRSDKARLRYPQRLDVLPATDFTWVWNDDQSGASADVAVWRPDLTKYTGYYALGDVAVHHYSSQNYNLLPPAGTFVVKGEGDLLAPPTDYERIWDDTGSGGYNDGMIWEPVAPPGYTCLGNVVTPGYWKPSTDLIRCIKSAYVLPANPDWVWDDSGSGAHDDVSLYQSNPRDHRGLALSTFAGRPYIARWGKPAWVLNKSATANPELSGIKVDAAAATRFAPRVWLAEGETFFPSSVPFFQANVHLDASSGMRPRYTTDVADIGSYHDPSLPFLRGQSPAQTAVPVYAQIIERTGVPAGTTMTDVIYWTFYPFNLGKEVQYGVEIPFVGMVSGGSDWFGNHVGDWEHVTVRFIDGRPASVYVSAHDFGSEIPYGDKRLALPGGHPEVYAAYGSHGIYADAGGHEYKTLPTGQDLADGTGRGTAWDTWGSIVFLPDVSTNADASGPLSWWNLDIDWGNAPAGCELDVLSAGIPCKLESGPSPIRWRSTSYATTLTLQ